LESRKARLIASVII